MSERRPASGDVLDLHIVTSAQLFNSIDPAPFRERDLDPAVIAYMVEWVEEGVGNGPLTIAIGESTAHVISDERRAQVVADSAVIGAWVALWHPINIFLFDWWPLRRRAKLYDRLCAAEVRVVTGTAAVV